MRNCRCTQFFMETPLPTVLAFTPRNKTLPFVKDFKRSLTGKERSISRSVCGAGTGVQFWDNDSAYMDEDTFKHWGGLYGNTGRTTLVRTSLSQCYCKMISNLPQDYNSARRVQNTVQYEDYPPVWGSSSKGKGTNYGHTQ